MNYPATLDVLPAQLESTYKEIVSLLRDAGLDTDFDFSELQFEFNQNHFVRKDIVKALWNQIMATQTDNLTFTPSPKWSITSPRLEANLKGDLSEGFFAGLLNWMLLHGYTICTREMIDSWNQAVDCGFYQQGSRQIPLYHWGAHRVFFS
jgi:hypothetical protein